MRWMNGKGSAGGEGERPPPLPRRAFRHPPRHLLRSGPGRRIIFALALGSALAGVALGVAEVGGLDGAEGKRPAPRTALPSPGAAPPSATPVPPATRELTRPAGSAEGTPADPGGRRTGPAPAPYAWVRGAMIAHGMGAVGGLGLTNSKEAFERNHARGYRVFEVDLLRTRDGALVARHDWSRERSRRFAQPFTSAPSLEDFLATPIAGRYTPLDAERLADLLRAHPDSWLMTDVKAGSATTRVRAIRDLLRAAGPDAAFVRARLVVQVYEEREVAPLRALGIRDLVYTLYRLKTSRERALDFARARGIRVVTMPKGMATPAFLRQVRAHGLVAGVHTVNSPKEAAALRALGVRLLYSDSLAP